MSTHASHYKQLLAIGVLLAGRVWAQVPSQAVAEFTRSAPDGQPAGWDLVALGAQATLVRTDTKPPTAKLDYAFGETGGTIYLLCHRRLRAKPVTFEANLNGDGEQLGVLLRDGVDDELFEFAGDKPVEGGGWTDWTTTFKQPGAHVGGNGKLDSLPGGGGISFEGLILHSAGARKGSLAIRDLTFTVDAKDDQEAMVDLSTARFDNVFVQGEDPAPTLLVTNVSEDAAKPNLSWTITDGDGATVGQGQMQKEARPGVITAVPLPFTPPRPCGHFTVRATVDTGKSKRNATLRFVVVPATPAAGRRLGVTVEAHRGAPGDWLDRAVLRLLKRAGAGYARLELRWPDLEPSQGQRQWDTLDYWLGVSRAEGLPLVVNVSEAPKWLPARTPADSPPFVALLTEAAQRGGKQVAAWEVWQQPNVARFWPPKPQPYGFRGLLEGLRAPLAQIEGAPLLVNGGLSGFEPGYFGTLLSGDKPVLDRLGLTLPVPRNTLPGLVGETAPSDALLDTITKLQAWYKLSGRPVLPPWVVDVGVRTSPVEDTKLGQARELARSAAIAQGVGGSLFWRQGVDGADKADRFGLVRRDLEPKPALATFAAAAANGSGAVLLGRCQAPAGAHAWLTKTTAGLTVVVLGSDAALPPLEGEVTIHDLWGNALTAATARIGPSPLYLNGGGVVKAFPMVP